MKKLLFAITVTLWGASPLLAADTTPSAPISPDTVPRTAETPAQHDARMAWWREAKFGMFIHWGLYCIPADGEWHMRQHKESLSDYSKLANEFNPTKFNADEWAALAQDAGMKYLILTTKHHDGFAMFHSKVSAYNIYDATPFKRDPLKELSEACPRHDLKLGTYYSVIADWGHPGGGAGCPKWDPAQEGSLDDYINNVSIPQVRELLTNYGPIAVMWFDTDGSNVGSEERAARYEPVLALQPNIIIDPRLQHFPGDFQTAEGRVPLLAPKGDWELCTRTNGSWGYTSAPARTLADLLGQLTDAWGKGGNVLLNVGPTREGIIPPDSAECLREVGAWLKTNGEAIYGSEAGPFTYLPWGTCTRKGDHLYLIVLAWPTDGKLPVPISTPVTDAHLLADPGKLLKTHLINGKTIIDLPAKAPDATASVIALKVAGQITPYHSLLLDKPVVASEDQKDASHAVDDDSASAWRIPSASGSLQVDMGKPETFSVLRYSTPYTTVAKAVLEVQVGNEWKTVYSEDNPKGTEFVRTFPPVTGQVVRLTITADKPAMRIGDFELFPPL